MTDVNVYLLAHTIITIFVLQIVFWVLMRLAAKQLISALTVRFDQSEKLLKRISER